MGKTVLIVYAHHQRTSFNAALMMAAVETLRERGHTVHVSDLYGMNFNPIISRDDIIGPLQNDEHFDYSEETGIAWREGRVAEDIKEEQAKVSSSDLIIFQFPLHWMGMPAILKGWCDRVFLANYAFTETEVYDQGKFKGRKALLSFTTGAPEHFYTTHGPNGDMNVLLWPMQNGILRLIGFDVLSPHMVFGPQLQSCDSRMQHLKDWETRLTSIFEEPPLYFVPISKFKPVDPDNPLKGMELSEDTVKAEEECSGWGLTTGHHLNRQLPPSSMLKPRRKSAEPEGGISGPKLKQPRRSSEDPHSKISKY